MKLAKSQRHHWLIIGLGIVLWSPIPTQASPFCAPALANSPLKSLVDRFSRKFIRLDPFLAGLYDLKAGLDQFGGFLSPEQKARERALYQEAKVGLEKFSGDQLEKLDSSQRNLYELFSLTISNGLAHLDSPSEYYEFNGLFSRLKSYLDDTTDGQGYFPFKKVSHYEAFIKRSQGLGPFVDRLIGVLREGIAKGIVLNRQVAERALRSIESALESDIEKNPFFRPVLRMPEGFSKAKKILITNGFKQMIRKQILPAYLRFSNFYKTEYLPATRDSYGLAQLPGGLAWYRQEIVTNTDLDLDPAVIHQQGLDEVGRIESEMSKIAAGLGHRGDLGSFRKFLASGSGYFYLTAEQMRAGFESTQSLIDSKINQWFSLKPKYPFRILEADNAEDIAGAYVPPTDSMAYGRFILNTKNLTSIPVMGTDTLLVHEAIPGHHFQLSLAFELRDQLTYFERRLFYSTAYVEGWALYAEYLGREMGIYRTPLSRFGNLEDELLRAVRLVVDTGMHAFGWSRDRVIEYMSIHTGMPLDGIEIEADRYSVWPAQALSYKIGEIKIRQLREWAQSRLGTRFDIRGFHAAVIGAGTISLAVLDRRVREWVSHHE